MSFRFALVLFTCILIPWDVYQTVPALNVGIAGILLCFLGGLAAWDFQRTNSIRIPFEIWAPLLVMSAFEIWRTESIVPPSIGAAIALLVVAQNLRSRKEVMWSLAAMVASLGVFSLFNGMAYTAGATPTVFSLFSPISFFGPSSVQHAATLFGLAFFGSIALAASSQVPPFVRALGTFCILPPLGSLASTAFQLRESHYPWSAGHGLDGFTPGWFTLLVGFWITARIVVKSGLAEESERGVYRAFVAMGGVIAISFSVLPGDVPLVYGVVLGLILAYGLPETNDETAKVSRIQLSAISILSAVCIISNMVMPSVGNANDMRNVGLKVNQLESDETREKEVRYLYGALENYPTERVFTLMALGLNSGNDAEQVSQYIVQATQDAPVIKWDSESTVELNELILRLRDQATQSSGDGNEQFFYERALAASDSLESALHVLRIRADKEDPALRVPVPDPLIREVISWAITGERNEAVNNELSTWDSDQLQKLIRMGQIEIHNGETWKLPFNEPVVLFFGQHGDNYVCRIWSGARSVEQSLEMVTPWPMSESQLVARPPSAEWLVAAMENEDNYQIDLRSPGIEESWLHIEFTPKGEPSIHWPIVNNWALPNEPITVIWLP